MDDAEYLCHITVIKRSQHERSASHIYERTSFLTLMPEDLQATRRFVSVKAVQNIKSYLKSWRYGTSTTTTTGATANTGRSLLRGALRVRDRQVIQETTATRSSGPTETIHLFPGWAVRRYVDDGVLLGAFFPALSVIMRFLRV